MIVDTFWQSDKTVTVKLDLKDLNTLCDALGVADTESQLDARGLEIAQVLGSLEIILEKQQ